MARITQTPFMIGRGVETGNHLQLSDRPHFPATAAAVVIEGNRFYLEDRGQRRGPLRQRRKKSKVVNSRIATAITFGLDDSYEIIFRSAKSSDDDFPSTTAHPHGAHHQLGAGRRPDQAQASP